MPREIPRPWTEAHEQALADYIKFAYEEAQRDKSEEAFLPEEEEAYNEAMRRVEELGVLDRPEATIKLKALDVRLKRLRHSGTPPPPRKAEDLEDPEGQPTEEREPKAIRGVPRAGSVPRELPVEPLPSATIKAAEGTPAANAGEGEETSGAADRDAPPDGTTPAEADTPGERPQPTPALRRPKRWEKAFAELTTPPKTPEEQTALEKALRDLKDLPADEQTLLEKEAEIFLSNNEIPVAPDNRARLIREASLLILRRYPDWSRERVLNPPPETEPTPTSAERRRGKREYPANPPEVQTEIETFLQGLKPEQSTRLQAEIQKLVGRTADGNEQVARDHILRYYSLDAIKKIAGPEAPPAPEPEPEPTPPPVPAAREPTPHPAVQAREYPPSHEEDILLSEAGLKLAKEKGIHPGDAYQLVLKAARERGLLQSSEPFTREDLDRAIAGLEPAPPTAQAEPTAKNFRTYEETRQHWELVNRLAQKRGLDQWAAYDLAEKNPEILKEVEEEAPAAPPAPTARRDKRKKVTPIPMGREEKEAAFARFAQKQAQAAAAATEYRPRRPGPTAEAISPDEDEIQRVLEEARKNEADLTRKEAIQRLLSRPDLYPTTGPTRAERLAHEETLAQEDEVRRLIAANPDMSAFTPEEARAQAMRLLENSPDEFPNDGGLTQTQRRQAIKEKEWALLGYEKPETAAPEATKTETSIEEAEDAAARAAAAGVAATVAADESAVADATREAERRQGTTKEVAPPEQDLEAGELPGLEERMRQLAERIKASRTQAGALLETYPHLQPSREAPAAKREKPKFGQIARGLLTHLGAAAAKTAGSLLGVKILYDLPAWIREKHALKRERQEIQTALIEMTRGFKARRREKQDGRGPSKETADYARQTILKFRETIRDAKHLAPKERLEYRKHLRTITAKHRRLEEELNGEENARIVQLSKLYLGSKISGYQVAREALNSALVLAGMPVLRGAAYAATAAAERWSKAGREWEKAAWGGEHSASFRGKKIAQAKDLFITSTVETLHGLTGGTLLSKKAKEERTGLQRTGEFFQAASKLAIAFGIGGAALNALLERPPTEVIDDLMNQFEEKGVAGMIQEAATGISEQDAAGLAEAAAHNWWRNLNDMTERFTTLRFDRTEGTRGPHAFGSLSDEVRHLEATAPPTHDQTIVEAPGGMSPEATKQFQEAPPTEPPGLAESEIQSAREAAPAQAAEITGQQNEQLREVGRALGVVKEWTGTTEPEALARALAEAPAATIEQGSNVWDAAKSLVGEGQGKISAKEFAQAWEHSVRNLPDLVHPGDVVKFVPAAEGSPTHFEVIAESGFKTGTAKDLVEVYKNLGKDVPGWLQEKIAPSAEIIKQTDQIVAAQPDEFSSALSELHRDFRQSDLAKQEEVLRRIHDLRQRLEYEWHLAADNQDRETALFEEMQRLDATRQRLTLAPDFAGQNRSFLEMLKSAELPQGKLTDLKTLTVERLLAEKDSPGRRDFTGLVRLVQDYLKITPPRERPLQLTVEVFLKKFVVGGKAIEPPTAV